MNSKTHFASIIFATVFLLLSDGVTVSVNAFSINWNSIHMGSSSTDSAFNDGSWDSACSSMNLISAGPFDQPEYVLSDLFDELRAISDSTLKVWISRRIENGISTCEEASVVGSSFINSVSDCAETKSFLCKAPRPVLQRLSAGLRCHATTSASSSLYLFTLRKVDGSLTMVQSGNAKDYIFDTIVPEEGNFSCIITTMGVISATSEPYFKIIAVPKPRIGFWTADLGQEAKLICESDYDGYVDRTYDFSKPSSGGLITNSYVVEKNELIIPSMTVAEGGNYACAETISGVISSWSFSNRLEYRVPKPIIQAEANYTQIVLGDTVVLNCNTAYSTTIDSVSTRSYRWYRSQQALTTSLNYNGGSIVLSEARTSAAGIDWVATGSNPQTTISDFKLADVSRYSCTEVIGDKISPLSEQIQLKYVVLDAVFQTSTPEVTLGSTANFKCNVTDVEGASASLTHSIVWYYSTDTATHAIVKKATSIGVEIAIPSFQYDNVGYYACEVSDDVVVFPLSDWVAVGLTVPAPVLTASSLAAPLGSDVTWTCQSSIPLVSNGVDPFVALVSVVASTPALSIDQRYDWHFDPTTGDAQYIMNKVVSTLTIPLSGYALGNASCWETAYGKRSGQSNVVTSTFTVPKPDLELLNLDILDPIDATTLVNLKCATKYPGDLGLTRSYRLYVEFHNLNPRLISTLPSSQFDGIRVREKFTCLEVIEGVESVKSDQLKLNVTVKTPIIHEQWDLEHNRLTLNCRTGYSDGLATQIENDADTVVIWFINGGQFVPTAAQTLSPFQVVLDGVVKQNSGTFQCWYVAYFIVSVKSTVTTTEDIVNLPVLVSSSQETVPSGSKVRLRCEWTSSGTATKFKWKRNGKTVKTSEDNVYVIRTFKKKHNGNYTCIAGTDDKESEPVFLKAVDPFALCYCPCDNTTSNVTLSVKAVEQIVSDIKTNLTVPTDSLSATIREKTSAPDRRVSSVSAGLAAVALLSGTILLIVLSDAIRVIHWVVTTIQTVSGRPIPM